MKTFLFVVTAAFAGISQSAFAQCFHFVGNGPQSVGPVALAAPASKVCVYEVHGFAGNYYSIDFSDDRGTLAQLASHDEAVGRCPGFCRDYKLESGNANGRNVNPDNTHVAFQVETRQGKVTFSHPSTGSESYEVSR